MQMISETRMAFSHPPAPKAVRPALNSPAEVAHYQEDLATYQKAAREDEAVLQAWTQAHELLADLRGLADCQMRHHDNDFGAVGKYDLNPKVGVMALKEDSPERILNVFGASRKVPMPKHFWQKQRYATVVTDYHETSGRPNQAPSFERSYQSALSTRKFPSVLWESASQTTASGRNMVEADYSNDVLVWRQYSQS